MLPPRFSPSTTTSPRAALVALLLVVAGFLGSRADDDGEGPIPPPVDPGAGFEGVLPRPRLLPYLVRDQGTSPMGLRQVFNTPETIMGQSFTPATNVLDWVAFVFQNHPQPGTVPGPGTVRVRLYTSLSSNGELDGLLGESDEVTIGERETAWLVFTFARTLAVTPGTRYFCRVEWVGGYPCWVGGRLQDVYPRGGAFGFLPNPFGGPVQNLRWDQYDLVFATGAGRSPSGVPPGALGTWARAWGVDDFDERQDADADGWSLLTEYLQGTHPARPDALPVSRIHGGDGASGLFGWTIGVRTNLPFAALRDGSLAAPLGLQREVVRGVEAWDGGASLQVLDAGPADASGLAPLLPGYQYRTFRLAEPRAAVGAGYLVRELHGK